MYFVIGAVVVAIAGFVILAKVSAARERKAMEARPRITAQELQQALDDMAADRRDSLVLTLHEQPTAATATRIGGRPLADPAHGDWPTAANGRPTEFLGQINFAELPPLPDFPTSGLLQMFVGGYLERAHLRYIENPVGEALMEHPSALLQGKTRQRTFSTEVLARGYAVTAEPREVEACDLIWPYEDAPWAHARDNRLPEPGEAEALDAGFAARMEVVRKSWGDHWIGGHPSFVQGDIRGEEAHRHLDRVILHLGEEGVGRKQGITLGDAGELNVMISAQDLRDRRWDKAVFHWDCG